MLENKEHYDENRAGFVVPKRFYLTPDGRPILSADSLINSKYSVITLGFCAGDRTDETLKHLVTRFMAEIAFGSKLSPTAASVFLSPASSLLEDLNSAAPINMENVLGGQHVRGEPNTKSGIYASVPIPKQSFVIPTSYFAEKLHSSELNFAVFSYSLSPSNVNPIISELLGLANDFRGDQNSIMGRLSNDISQIYWDIALNS